MSLERTEPALAISLVVLAAATAYETLIALQAVALGAEPGSGASWEALARFAAIVAMLVGVGFVVVDPASLLAALLPLGAAAFMLARFYTFDPYYLPTLRRMSDQGLVSPVLVFVLLALALGAALLIRARPRPGSVVVAPVVLACAFIAFVMGGGH